MHTWRVELLNEFNSMTASLTRYVNNHENILGVTFDDLVDHLETEFKHNRRTLEARVKALVGDFK